MTDNLLKIREAFVKEGGENCNGVRWTDEAINRIAELEAAILNIGQKIDRETYANVKAAILDAVKIVKGN